MKGFGIDLSVIKSSGSKKPTKAQLIAIEKEKARKQATLRMLEDSKFCKGYMKKIESSKSRNIEFSLSFIEFSELMSQTHCAYSGIKFDSDNRSSLERVNPNEGYVTGNVVSVTVNANCDKSALDQFVKSKHIPAEMKLKLLRKASYQIEKLLKETK